MVFRMAVQESDRMIVLVNKMLVSAYMYHLHLCLFMDKF